MEGAWGALAAASGMAAVCTAYFSLLSAGDHMIGTQELYGPSRTVMENVRIASLAVSLGGVETLIEHPASMTHAGMDRARREAVGISDGLVRLAVGCEDAEDPIEDLEHALEAV